MGTQAAATYNGLRPDRQVASPFPGVRHRGPGFPWRLRLALLQKFDRMQVGRAHECHVAVTWRPVDGDAAFLQLVTDGIDVVDLVGEMSKVARLAVVLGVPV